MEKKRKTRTGTNKRKQVKEDKFLKNTILGLFFLNSFFIVFSFFGNTGFLGNFIKNTFQRFFGNTYFLFLLIMEIIYLVVLFNKMNKKNKNRCIMSLLLFFNYMAIVDLSNNSSNNLSIKLAISKTLSAEGSGSGYIGAILGYFYNIMIGTIGLYIFTFMIGLFLILSFLDVTFMDFLKIIKGYILKLFVIINEKYSKYKEKKALKKEQKNDEEVEVLNLVENEEFVEKVDDFEEREIIVSNHNDNFIEEKEIENEKLEKEELLDSFNLFPDDDIKEDTKLSNKISNEKEEILDIKTTTEKKKIEYKIPSLNLLKGSETKETESESTLKQRAKKIETTLKSFGVGAKVVRINKGPTVTCFELQPDMGVKVNKIVNLTDDLSLALASPDIRIEAPIPGKSVIGIEVANTLKENVSLKEILSSKEYQNSESKMPMALGKTISGEIIVSSIDKMPHILIAGATGSGKSVCINTLIMSILYKSSPEDVKMILIDPKVVELKIYNKIPHLAIPVVTDSKKASAALNWAVREMERRYTLFSDNQVRDIKGYNEKQKTNELEKLPYLVIIIDELSDLMMVSANEVESYICRLAQMARACGIHLVVATQRPSVDVITGTIKANIPSRISFQVSSQIDSRTILDASGAETLLGKGDMLFNPSGVSKPIRIQGCFVSDSEVEDVVDSIKEQMQEVFYDEEIIKNIESEVANTVDEEDDVDDLFYDAVRIVLEENSASISLLQRKMKIGYARAGRIIDEMESRMIVGKQEGSKPRKILIGFDYFDKLKGDNNEYSE
ncbi:DNA translocase FtsK [Parvimonas parva]|uniref:DNA translocase FtsK n=1 Tax=Parvimonas parva TaxID=2769485 RepID=UPI0038B412B2